MADPKAGINPELAIKNSIPGHLEELHKERARLVTKLLALNERIALCESLALLAPQPEPDNGSEP